MSAPLTSYLSSRLVRVGLIVATLGALPLVTVLVAAALGVTDDPNPNPVAFGIVFTVTFWPGLTVAALGAILHHRHRTTRDA